MRLFVLWWTGSFSTCTHMVMSHLVWKFVLWYTFNRVLVWLDCFVLIVQVFFVSPLFRLHRYGICHYDRCQCLARWRLENKAMMQPLRRKLDRPSIPYGMNNDIFSVENLQFIHICLFLVCFSFLWARTKAAHKHVLFVFVRVLDCYFKEEIHCGGQWEEETSKGSLLQFPPSHSNMKLIRRFSLLTTLHISFSLLTKQTAILGA